MRRNEIIKTLNKIAVDLTDVDIERIFSRLYRPTRDSSSEGSGFPTEVYREFVIRTNDYESIEIEILEKLGLSGLLEPETWSNLVSNPDPDFYLPLHRNLSNATRLLPKLATILERESDYKIERSQETAADGLASLTIVIAEDDQNYSTPDRLIETLKAVQSLYEAFAMKHGGSSNTLSVIGCDSGSDKSFDFLGFAATIKEVRETIAALWDRIFFYKQTKAKVSFEAVAASLPILQDIDAMKESNTLSPEVAEQMKMKIIAASSGLLKAGAHTEDAGGAWVEDIRQIAKPEPKLLSAPEYSAGETNKNTLSQPEEKSFESTGEVTPEEIERMRQLIDQHDRATTNDMASEDPAEPNAKQRTTRKKRKASSAKKQ